MSVDHREAESNTAPWWHAESSGADPEVLLMPLDVVAQRQWRTGFTSWTQTYADLFASPGWQASEFRRAMNRERFATDDWARIEEGADGYIPA